MTSSISSNGVPLSSIFDPYVSGTKARTTGIDDNGQELSNLFAPIYLGSAAAATGIQSIGADLNTLYAAHGTAVYSIPGIQGKGYLVSATASGVSGQPGASVNLAMGFLNDGTYSFTGTVVSAGGGSGVILEFPDSGTWLPSGWTVSTTQIQFSYVETVLEYGAASKVNPAPTYTSLSTSQTFTMSAACGATSPNGNGSRLAMTIRIKNTTTSAVITTTCTVTCDAAPGV